LGALVNKVATVTQPSILNLTWMWIIRSGSKLYLPPLHGMATKAIANPNLFYPYGRKGGKI